MKSQDVIKLTEYTDPDSANAALEDGVTDELSPGTSLLHGQYKILGYLKAGGFGVTYLARDGLNRQVVIKECFPEMICRRKGLKVVVNSPKYRKDMDAIVEEFMKEAESLANLDHPNIISVHQAFEENATAYLALDYVEGRDLLEIAEDHETALSAHDVIHFTTKMLHAIRHVHDAGILHRDISPDNILIDKYGEPMLIDFGAARIMVTSGGRKLSKLKFVKDGYSPQEFYVEGEPQGPPSDLYSFAASLYHVIAGEPPASAELRVSELAAKRRDPYRPLVGYFPDFPDEFLSGLDKSLSVYPENRFQTATEWLGFFSAADEKTSRRKRTDIHTFLDKVDEEAAFDRAKRGGVGTANAANDDGTKTRSISPMAYINGAAVAVLCIGFSIYAVMRGEDQAPELPTTAASAVAPNETEPRSNAQDTPASEDVASLAPVGGADQSTDATNPDATLGENATLSTAPTSPAAITQDGVTAETEMAPLSQPGGDITNVATRLPSASTAPLSSSPTSLPVVDDEPAAFSSVLASRFSVPTVVVPSTLNSNETNFASALQAEELGISFEDTKVASAIPNSLQATTGPDSAPAFDIKERGPDIGSFQTTLAAPKAEDGTGLTFSFELSPIALPKTTVSLAEVSFSGFNTAFVATAPTAPVLLASAANSPELSPNVLTTPQDQTVLTDPANLKLPVVLAERLPTAPQALAPTSVTTSIAALAPVAITSPDLPKITAAEESQDYLVVAALSQPNTEQSIALDTSAPEPLLADLLERQVSYAHWDVSMPFISEIEKVRNANLIRITGVTESADLGRSGDWITEDVLIYAFNGQALAPDLGLESMILNELSVDPDGYARASVRFRAPDGIAIEKGLLAVPAVGKIGLADGTELEARVIDLGWALVVTKTDTLAAGDLRVGDVIVQEHVSETTITDHQTLATALDLIVAKQQGAAEFSVLRDGDLIKARQPLARN